MPDLIKSLEEAAIIGRGGAEYGAHLKWKVVRDAVSPTKYVICNASEREPAVFKDFHILSQFPERVFKGMQLAMETVHAKEGIFNLNGEYYAKLKDKLDPLIAESKEKGFSMRIFEEDPSYIGGEETALLNAIENRRVEPRMKPPFPTEKGLFGMPTLVHNVETLFDIAAVADGTYEGKRFYSFSGAVKKSGVFQLDRTLTILDVLRKTKNTPKEDFFVQVGGGASGVVLNGGQIKDETVHGAGSVIVHLMKEDPKELMITWLDFFQRESCGKCTPCREGTYQLVRLLEDHEEIPWEKMQPIFEVLSKTAFCSLGRCVPIAPLSYFKNVLPYR